MWLTREQLATIYQTTQENVSMHITNVYTDEELDREGTYKKFLLVRQEGKRQVRRNMDHYNLDMIIALGYRVQSPIAVVPVVGLPNGCMSIFRRASRWMMSG